jgi:hypothetical protein
MPPALSALVPRRQRLPWRRASLEVDRFSMVLSPMHKPVRAPAPTPTLTLDPTAALASPERAAAVSTQRGHFSMTRNCGLAMLAISQDGAGSPARLAKQLAKLEIIHEYHDAAIGPRRA